jgi:hypothetical protein
LSREAIVQSIAAIVTRHEKGVAVAVEDATASHHFNQTLRWVSNDALFANFGICKSMLCPQPKSGFTP